MWCGIDRSVHYGSIRAHSSTVLPVGSKRLQSQITALLAPVAEGDVAQSEAARTRHSSGSLHRTVACIGSQFHSEESRSDVVIIPDGALFNLPFAALIDGQGKYLVENHLLTMASSMGVLLDNRPRYADDLSVVITSNNASGDESHQITQNLQPELVTRLTGNDAEISAITEQSRGKAVVHFTNNTPLSTNPMRSLMPVSSGKADGSKKLPPIACSNRVFRATWF